MKNSAPWKKLLPRPNPEFPRRVLPSKIDFSNWESLKPYAEEIENRKLGTKSSLKKWMEDISELLNAAYDEESRLYVTMTCDTRHENSEAYARYMETIDPEIEKFYDNIRARFLREPKMKELPKTIYGKWKSSLKISKKLFHNENLDLIPKVSRFARTYQKTCGAMTINWKGQKKTVIQMNHILQDKDRDIREKAWKKTWDRYIQDREKINNLFDKQLVLREQIAGNLGLSDFREYSFRKYLRTDYSIKDCYTFHETIEKVVTPVYREVLKAKQEKLGIDSLRPWDMACSPSRAKPLKPFKTEKDLIAGCDKIFHKVDPELAGFFRVMQKNKLLDLSNRVGKAPGGYQIQLDEARLPFIFMNAVGSNNDVFTLLHEGGHAFHSFLSRGYDLPDLRRAPMEFCEVASMSMERMGMSYLGEFYSPDEGNRAIAQQDEDVFRLFAWIAIVDSFQHWIYTHPGHTRSERNGVWIETMNRFQQGLNWNGLRNYQKTAWHRQLHIFQYPFYYIEYGIALIGALQMWLHFRKNKKKALDRYKAALKCGGTLGLKDLFNRAGLVLDFTPKTVEPLIKEVYREWESLV